ENRSDRRVVRSDRAESQSPGAPDAGEAHPLQDDPDDRRALAPTFLRPRASHPEGEHRREGEPAENDHGRRSRLGELRGGLDTHAFTAYCGGWPVAAGSTLLLGRLVRQVQVEAVEETVHDRRQ